VADKRVIGTAPIVIDTLNFPVQMKHQLDTWGEYSEQIADYTSKGLVKPDGVPRTMREDHLWKMMDPFTYREQLTLPKLIINGANDRYWVSDALKNYWDELRGPKHVLMVPNAGHNLGGGREGALTTLGVFFRHTAAGKELPQLKWELAKDGNNQKFTISATQPAQAARLWVAKSDNRDFRESAWQPVALEGKSGEYRGTVTKPETGHVAMFGELQFEFDNLLYSLTSRTFLE
jgi:PhoPQ-activated pathogenicity-related protein